MAETTGDPRKTADGRYLVIGGRRWRATDPDTPPEIQAQLRTLLMDARRAVKKAKRDNDPEAERQARARVQLAKVALGERGTPWWEQTDSQRKQRWTEGLQKLIHGQSVRG